MSEAKQKLKEAFSEQQKREKERRSENLETVVAEGQRTGHDAEGQGCADEQVALAIENAELKHSLV